MTEGDRAGWAVHASHRQERTGCVPCNMHRKWSGRSPSAREQDRRRRSHSRRPRVLSAVKAAIRGGRADCGAEASADGCLKWSDLFWPLLFESGSGGVHLTLSIFNAVARAPNPATLSPTPPVTADAVEPKSRDGPSPHQATLAWWWGFALGFARPGEYRQHWDPERRGWSSSSSLLALGAMRRSRVQKRAGWMDAVERIGRIKNQA
jgi:hypothetical protein